MSLIAFAFMVGGSRDISAPFQGGYRAVLGFGIALAVLGLVALAVAGGSLLGDRYRSAQPDA